MGNAFVHIELHSQAVGQAKEFYGQLFDWNLEDMPMQNTDEKYTMVNVGEGTGGGMMQHPEKSAPSAWTPFVLVDSVEKLTQKAKDLGATILKDTSEVPEHGWYSIFQDPTGAILGLWENKS